MKIFETPVLLYGERFKKYECVNGPLFACAEIVEELFDTPRDSEIKFVAYDKPNSRRHEMFIERYLCPTGLERHWIRIGSWAIVAMHGELRRFLAEIYRKYKDRIFYVECEVQ
jgi:hypothetical protein